MEIGSVVRIKNSNVTGVIVDFETVLRVRYAWVHFDDAQHTGLHDESPVAIEDLEVVK